MFYSGLNLGLGLGVAVNLTRHQGHQEGQIDPG